MANTTRLTLTFPNDLERRLRRLPNKSAFVSAAVSERLDRDKAARMAGALAEAYAAAAKEDAALVSDWESTLGDGL